MDERAKRWRAWTEDLTGRTSFGLEFYRKLGDEEARYFTSPASDSAPSRAMVFTLGQQVGSYLLLTKSQRYVDGIVALYAAGYLEDAALVLARLLLSQSSTTVEYGAAASLFLPVLNQRLDGVTVTLHQPGGMVAVPEYGGAVALARIARQKPADTSAGIESAFADYANGHAIAVKLEPERGLFAALEAMCKRADPGLETPHIQRMLWRVLVVLADVKLSRVRASFEWLPNALFGFHAYTVAADAALRRRTYAKTSLATKPQVP